MGKMIWAIMLLIMIGVAVIIGNSTRITNPKPALRITVMTDLDQNGTAKVTNMTLEQTTVPFFYKRADSPVQFPEIDTYVRYNTLASEPMSYWASIPFNPNKNGIYVLTITFRDGKEPKVGDLLILPVKLIGYHEYLIEKKTALYEWK